MKWPTCNKLIQDPDKLIEFFDEYQPAIAKVFALVNDFNAQKDSKLVDMDGRLSAITDFATYLRLKLDKLP